MSFCRITGRARNLPKPNFFPIIPPISPADARRLCRVTGKRMDYHNYVPLIEAGRRPDCVRGLITQKNQNKENKSGNNDKSGSIFGLHDSRNDFKYVTPILRKEVMEKSDMKAFEDLQKVLKKLKKGLGHEDEEKNYVYLLPSVLCGLIVPPEVEEAIRKGEIESVSVSKSCEKAVFKIKGKPTLFIPLKEVDIYQGSARDKLYDGRGQSKETLNKQKQAAEAKKRKTLANKKIFEDLEKQADEEMLKDLEQRPAGKGRRRGNRTKEAQKYRNKIAGFQENFTADGNMTSYGDWQAALKASLHELDWEQITNVKALQLDSPMPKKARVEPLSQSQLQRQRKRIKNVFVPDEPGLELVPVFDEVPIHDVNIPKDLISLIKQSKSDGCSAIATNSSLKSMFAQEESLKDPSQPSRV